MSARLFPRNLLHLVMFAAVCLLVLRPGVCAWSSESADVQGADKDAAAEPPPKPPDKVPVIVSVNVPLNANARDEFILSPFPVEPPKVTDNDFELPTGSDELKLLLKNTVLYKRGEAGQHPPDWRVDRALKLGLDHSRKHLPLTSAEIDGWLDGFLPYFQNEVLIINAQEKLRRTRFNNCGMQEYARQAYREDAATKGLVPISLRVRPLKRGIRQDKTSVEPHFWWVVGTHSVPGLTYYWQEQRCINAGDTRLLELNEENAALIRGHY